MVMFMGKHEKKPLELGALLAQFSTPARGEFHMLCGQQRLLHGQLVGGLNSSEKYESQLG